MPRRSSGRVTLQHIAERVGVTKITVSRALREPHRVSAALRLRIESAIDELGYIPNHSAGTLASGRSHSVALLIPSLSNSVFSEIQRGIQEGLGDAGYQVLIGHTGYSILEEERLIETTCATASRRWFCPAHATPIMPAACWRGPGCRWSRRWS